MIPGALAKRLKKQITSYEGNVSHMYLDSEGYVTVGIGSLIPSLKAAQKLPFVHNKTLKKATSKEIQQDYTKIKSQPKGKYSFKYKKYTKLILTQKSIDNLFATQINQFHKELKLLYPKFDLYPTEVKMALFDMIYNLGMSKLKNLFPKFNLAIKQKNWKEAAKQSHRKPTIPQSRNNYVKNLLLNAATSNSNLLKQTP